MQEEFFNKLTQIYVNYLNKNYPSQSYFILPIQTKTSLEHNNALKHNQQFFKVITNLISSMYNQYLVFAHKNLKDNSDIVCDYNQFISKMCNTLNNQLKLTNNANKKVKLAKQIEQLSTIQKCFKNGYIITDINNNLTTVPNLILSPINAKKIKQHLQNKPTCECIITKDGTTYTALTNHTELSQFLVLIGINLQNALRITNGDNFFNLDFNISSLYGYIKSADDIINNDTSIYISDEQADSLIKLQIAFNAIDPHTTKFVNKLKTSSNLGWPNTFNDNLQNCNKSKIDANLQTLANAIQNNNVEYVKTVNGSIINPAYDVLSLKDSFFEMVNSIIHQNVNNSTFYSDFN